MGAKGFNVIALDEDYKTASLLRYTNLQWNRKYHEPGIFSIEIPVAQYQTNYKYIYTKDRPEMGIIEQVNYINQKGYEAIHLSGYFLEEELNSRVVYRCGQSNIMNAPSWNNQKGKAEDVAFAYFNAFKDVIFSDGKNNFQCLLGIRSGECLSRGKISDHERCGEYLGHKIYKILKPSEMSYRISYDFESNVKMFTVWSGIDRTQKYGEENPVTFSTRYRNIKDPNILINNANYRNACIVDNESNGVIYSKMMLNRMGDEDECHDRISYVKSSINRSDYAQDNAFYSSLESEGREELAERVRLINVEFDAMEGSYEYMTDFDLGDKCNIEIPEMNISASAVLIGCYEVIKSGTWSLTLEFGTPMLRRQ